LWNPGIGDPQCRHLGEVLKHTTEQRRFVPRADSLELSQADAGRDTIWVLWDVHAPKDQVVFGREFNGAENAFLAPTSSTARNERREGEEEMREVIDDFANELLRK